MTYSVAIHSTSNYLLSLDLHLAREYNLFVFTTIEELIEIKADIDVVLIDIKESSEFERLGQEVRSIDRFRYTPLLFLVKNKHNLNTNFPHIAHSPVISILKPYAPIELKTNINVLAELKKQREDLYQSNEALRENEKKLIKAVQDAEEAALTKSQFLANMSHEIRTPLNGIMGMLDLIERNTLDKETKELVETITSSSTGLMRILNDILDLSKLEAGELVIIEEPFSLDDCLRHIINQFSGLSKNKNLTIINNCNSISDLNIISDELRIKQVLSNLISNAIKFSNDKDIEVGVKVLNKLEQNIKLEIYVKDQGIGISPEALTKILDPFSQADATTTRLYGGTGLGLTISKKIVEILGGTLKIESELGKGSCFSIIFDFSIPMQSNYDTQLINIDHDLEEYEHHSINILLVEDNIVNQKVMGKYFKKLNYDIKIVNNGIEAVDICSKEKFDLIFMDMQMPQMGGVEATRLIRKNSLNESTFIVALTANVLKVHKEECLAVGMNQFITKPVKINQIKKSIVDSINFNSLKLKK